MYVNHTYKRFLELINKVWPLSPLLPAVGWWGCHNNRGSSDEVWWSWVPDTILLCSAPQHENHPMALYGCQITEHSRSWQTQHCPARNIIPFHTQMRAFSTWSNPLDVLVHFVANQRKIVFCAICYFAKSCWQFCKSHSSRWVYTTVNGSPTLTYPSVHPHWSRWIPGGFEQRSIGITHPWYHPSCRCKNELRVKEVLLTIHFEIEKGF